MGSFLALAVLSLSSVDAASEAMPMRMKITVALAGKTSFDLDVQLSATDTILDVKQEIWKQNPELTQDPKQGLILAPTRKSSACEMENDKTLADYKVKEGTHIYLMDPLPGHITIFAHIHDGSPTRTIVLEAKGDDKIKSVTEKLEKKGIQVKRILWMGHLLNLADKKRTLQELAFLETSNIYVDVS